MVWSLFGRCVLWCIYSCMYAFDKVKRLLLSSLDRKRNCEQVLFSIKSMPGIFLVHSWIVFWIFLTTTHWNSSITYAPPWVDFARSGMTELEASFWGQYSLLFTGEFWMKLLYTLWRRFEVFYLIKIAVKQ